MKPMKTISKHFENKTASRRHAFTLVELLVVISIIGVLAAFTIVGTKAVSKVRKISTAKGELAQLETALENYKAKYGVYPPGNGAGTLQAGLTNQLYYELSGVSINSAGNYQTLDSSTTIKQTDFQIAFGGVGGILNSTKGSGEDAASAKNFLPGLKPNQIASVRINGVDITNLVTSVGGTDDTYMPLNVAGVNPFRYICPGTNNPNSYDLWVQLSIDGKKNLICNWSKTVQINSSLP